jgi:lysophospholipase L1-like esterase
VAIGNSITQGTGQQASYQTYPFILAQKKGWTLYNLAVGGSKISWPVARLLQGKKVDVITILWGYNDWNAGFLPDKQIKNNYTKLLKGLLKAQPQARIYCILPTYTNRTTAKKGTATIDGIRQAEAAVVKSFQKKGYHNLFVVDGSKISDSNFLKPKGSKDVVHFTPEGAKKFATALYKMMNTNKNK